MCFRCYLHPNSDAHRSVVLLHAVGSGTLVPLGVDRHDNVFLLFHTRYPMVAYCFALLVHPACGVYCWRGKIMFLDTS